MSTETMEKENEEIDYAKLFGVKYCLDMPDMSNEPTSVKRAQEAAEFLKNCIFPPELIEILKR